MLKLEAAKEQLKQWIEVSEEPFSNWSEMPRPTCDRTPSRRC